MQHPSISPNLPWRHQRHRHRPHRRSHRKSRRSSPSNTDTGSTHTTTTSSAGEFLFQDLPLGTYSVSASFPGFNTVKTDKVVVTAGTTFTLAIKLTISSSSTVIEVDAAGVALDTTSPTQTTDISSAIVNDTPMNGRDFTQLIAVAPGFGGYSAGGFGSVNGTRANQVNWQIDGVDNNDLWHNVPAVNQGGVEGIAGIILPLDSVEQYSQQTQSTAEAGRNPGGVVNIVTKSGTNQIHGSVYYFNRNEFVAANSPFANGAPKGKLRNQNYGASLGGPILKDKLFYFFNYEKQQFIITSPASTTEPTTAFQTDSTALLKVFNLAPTSVATASLATVLSGRDSQLPHRQQLLRLRQQLHQRRTHHRLQLQRRRQDGLRHHAQTHLGPPHVWRSG